MFSFKYVLACLLPLLILVSAQYSDYYGDSYSSGDSSQSRSLVSSLFSGSGLGESLLRSLFGGGLFGGNGVSSFGHPIRKLIVFFANILQSIIPAPIFNSFTPQFVLDWLYQDRMQNSAGWGGYGSGSGSGYGYGYGYGNPSGYQLYGGNKY